MLNEVQSSYFIRKSINKTNVKKEKLKFLQNMAVKTRLPWKRQWWRTRFGNFKMLPDRFEEKSREFGSYSFNGFKLLNHKVAALASKAPWSE